jgi:hypothetical protein
MLYDIDMDKVSPADSLHPAGEGNFRFPTPGGMIALSPTQAAMTPFGGFVPWAAFINHIDIVQQLAKTCPVKRTSPNASSVYDILQTFMLTALADGRRFSHIERMREDPTIPEIFGMDTVVNDDTVRRFFKSVEPEVGAEWLASAMKPFWRSLPDFIIMDWDSTVLTKYGHQEDAEIGYNPTKPGRPSLHPLLGVVAGTRLCPVFHMRPGDTVTSTQWDKSMEDAQRWLGDRRVDLNRGDIGLGNETVMAWHEQVAGRPKYLFKLKLTSNVKKAIAAVPADAWVGPDNLGTWQFAETHLKLQGWSAQRRVILSRKLQGMISTETSGEFWESNKHEFAVYVTSLPHTYNAQTIHQLYRDRADVENVFDELKNQWGFNGFCAKNKATTELAARLTLLVYNLWTFFVRFIIPEKHTEAKKGRRWFLIIAARLVESGRQKVLQVSIRGGWAEQLKEGYTRLHDWIQSTAPQLKKVFSDTADFHPNVSPNGA